MTARASVVAFLLALGAAGDAVAQQMTYGQCADRARDRYMRGQVDPVIGPDRALDIYRADLRGCVDMDARNRTHEGRVDQQRVDQQRASQQRIDQQRDDQRRLNQRLDLLRDQQRLDQRLDQERRDDQRLEILRDEQRYEQQRLDQLRARQRDDMNRNRR